MAPRKHKYRIVVASSGLGHVARGVESWANDLAEVLYARGEDVILCKGGGVAEKPYEQVIPCYQRESPQTRWWVNHLPKRFFWRIGLGGAIGIEQLTFTYHLIPILRRMKADILHVQEPLLALWVQRARSLRILRTKVVLGHGTEESVGFLKKIEFLQHLAPWHLEEVKQAGYWKPTWTAIPNFIDTDQFIPGTSPELRRELGIPESAIVILTVAAIKRHHKRIDYLLQEYGQFREKYPDLPVYFVIAGGWESETDELIVEGQKRLGDRIRFLVRFPRSRMADLYRTANIFTLASLKEMMPIALIEAIATGLPCVVNQHPVLQWMIGSGGESIRMHESGSLCETLASWIQNPTECTRLGKQARQYCVENFAKEPVVEQILAYYDRVMGRSLTPLQNDAKQLNPKIQGMSCE